MRERIISNDFFSIRYVSDQNKTQICAKAVDDGLAS